MKREKYAVFTIDVEDFAEKVMGQHYIISYGNNTAEIRALCDMLGIKVI